MEHVRDQEIREAAFAVIFQSSIDAPIARPLSYVHFDQ